MNSGAFQVDGARDRATHLDFLMPFPRQPSASVLFVTLDSCRLDTFAAADAPNLKALGPVHRTQAPGTFTYGSHAAMFMGFTPGDATRREAFVNPKFGKIFRMVGGGLAGRAPEAFCLEGRNIVDGFRRRGHRVLGTGAMTWFNPAKPTTHALTTDFERLFYAGPDYSVLKQLAWLETELTVGDARPAFVFLNVGETHVPYWHEGADWDRAWNPCRAFDPDGTNDAAECARRQRACVEWLDARLSGLLASFAGANVVVCGDHGDAWGEDGLWEHGISHPKVLEVPLVFRLVP